MNFFRIFLRSQIFLGNVPGKVSLSKGGLLSFILDFSSLVKTSYFLSFRVFDSWELYMEGISEPPRHTSETGDLISAIFDFLLRTPMKWAFWPPPTWVPVRQTRGQILCHNTCASVEAS